MGNRDNEQNLSTFKSYIESQVSYRRLKHT
jgi:hypothetical protein